MFLISNFNNFKLKGKAKYVFQMITIMTYTIKYKLTPEQWLEELANTGRRN